MPRASGTRCNIHVYELDIFLNSQTWDSLSSLWRVDLMNKQDSLQDPTLQPLMQVMIDKWGGAAPSDDDDDDAADDGDDPDDGAGFDFDGYGGPDEDGPDNPGGAGGAEEQVPEPAEEQIPEPAEEEIPEPAEEQAAQELIFFESPETTEPNDPVPPEAPEGPIESSGPEDASVLRVLQSIACIAPEGLGSETGKAAPELTPKPATLLKERKFATPDSVTPPTTASSPSHCSTSPVCKINLLPAFSATAVQAGSVDGVPDRVARLARLQQLQLLTCTVVKCF